MGIKWDDQLVRCAHGVSYDMPCVVCRDEAREERPSDSVWPNLILAVLAITVMVVVSLLACHSGETNRCQRLHDQHAAASVLDRHGCTS